MKKGLLIEGDLMLESVLVEIVFEFVLGEHDAMRDQIISDILCGYSLFSFR